MAKVKLLFVNKFFTFNRDWYDMCLSTSIDPEFEALNFTIVPTLVNQHLEIHLDQVSKINFRIFDQVGNLIRNGNCHSANHQIMLDELPSGLYFIQIRDQENRIGIQKFVKM
ncbi:MAG: T9SS type A sorting domain-containing protein [Saprospiraceae bacterium]|nr:T9SS type A sorting domain-containing protein [Saprospiraceae bacterium]